MAHSQETTTDGRQALRGAAARIHSMLPDGIGFAMFVFPPDLSFTAYAADADRDDVRKLMDEFLSSGALDEGSSVPAESADRYSELAGTCFRAIVNESSRLRMLLVVFNFGSGGRVGYRCNCAPDLVRRAVEKWSAAF